MLPTTEREGFERELSEVADAKRARQRLLVQRSEAVAEVEAAVAEAKTAVEGGEPAAMTEKAQALAQVAMKMGQAIYEKQQQAEASPSAGGDAAAEAPKDDVVDAEFSEVDEDNNKG